MESRPSVRSVRGMERNIHLKAFDRQFYELQGYDLVNEVFSPKQCEDMIVAAQIFPSFQNNSLTPVMNPHKLHPMFDQALRHPKILEIMQKLFSETVSGLQSQFFFCRPGTPGFSMHQDNFYVQAKPNCFASAWVALDDVTSKNGGLFVFPGSHKEPILPTESIVQHTTFGQDPNANCRQAVLPPYLKKRSLALNKGGMVLIHGHTVHGSHDNKSELYRHALLLTYLKKGEAFRNGNSAQREEINLYDTCLLIS